MMEQAVSGYIFEATTEDNANIELFTYKEGNAWGVNETRSRGVIILLGESTRKQAVEQAEDKVRRLAFDDYLRRSDAMLARQGKCTKVAQ